MPLPVFAIRCILCIAPICVFSTAHAADSKYMADLQTRAQQGHIWQSAEWLNLLHYTGDGDTPGDYRSEVNDSPNPNYLRQSQLFTQRIYPGMNTHSAGLLPA